jgi:ABC-type polysaccharide/polyol phosphate export permease
MGSLLFGTLLDISNANFPLFFLLYLLSMIIVGSLLFCVVVAKPFQWVIENMWPRILLPLVALGALYYPWRPVSELMPITSKLMLLLPTVSIVEGLRSALTGNPLYLSAYWCGLGMLIFIVGIVSLVFCYMQKRIDPV